MWIFPDEERRSKAVEVVHTFSYRVKESTDGTIYFRAVPDQLSKNREGFLQLVALLKPGQGAA